MSKDTSLHLVMFSHFFGNSRISVFNSVENIDKFFNFIEHCGERLELEYEDFDRDAMQNLLESNKISKEHFGRISMLDAATGVMRWHKTTNVETFERLCIFEALENIFSIKRYDVSISKKRRRLIETELSDKFDFLIENLRDEKPTRILKNFTLLIDINDEPACVIAKNISFGKDKGSVSDYCRRVEQDIRRTYSRLTKSSVVNSEGTLQNMSKHPVGEVLEAIHDIAKKYATPNLLFNYFNHPLSGLSFEQTRAVISHIKQR